MVIFTELILKLVQNNRNCSLNRKGNFKGPTNRASTEICLLLESRGAVPVNLPRVRASTGSDRPS